MTSGRNTSHHSRVEQRAAQRNELAGADLSAPLFVPADRPDRVAKAAKRGARVIVIDLEDAIAPDHKAAARANATQALASHPFDGAYVVRVNSVQEPETLEADLAALKPVLNSVAGLVLPKITSVEQVHAVEALLPPQCDHLALIPTVETARGVRESWSIATASPLVHTLLFGPVDLSAELGIDITPDGTELLTARSTVVLACADAGLARPLDGPWPNLDDEPGLETSTRHARRLGFGGKIAIHPKQLTILAAGFHPSATEITWATEVTDVYTTSVRDGVGAARLADGTFIDAPVAARAYRILELARRTGSGT